MVVCLLFSTFLINASVDDTQRRIPQTAKLEVLETAIDAPQMQMLSMVEEVESRVVVKLKDNNYSKRTRTNIKEDVISTVGRKNVRHEFNSFNGFSATLSQKEIAELMNDSNVEEIIPVGVKYPIMHDTVGIINATRTWSLQYAGQNLTGKHQTVCVIDTGVNYSHADLGGCFGAGCKVISGYDVVDDDRDPMDDDGHGTHVAGIVAANGGIKGIAPDASIVAIDVFPAVGGASDDDIAAGIEWCTNNASKYNITVITMSLGAGLYNDYCDDDETAIALAINQAVANNISVLVASGNDANYVYISSPACIQNAIPVGASAKNDTIAVYSNTNWMVQLLAPGSNIVSTGLNGGTATMSGTSMATPVVAGAFAVMNQYLASQGLTKTSAQLESIFNSTGVRIRDVNYSNLDFYRVDLYEAIISLNISPTVVVSSPDNDTLILTNPVTINFTATDNLDGVLSCKLYDNNIVLTTFNASSGVLVSFGVNFSDGNHTWYINCSDDDGNFNVSEVRVFILDTTAPKYINKVMSPAEYSADGNYSFNVTWIEAVGIDNVTFNFNGINYSMFSLGGGGYYRTSSQTPTFTVATGTVYSYYFWANDTSGYSNITNVLNFSVIFPTASQTIANTRSMLVGDNITQIIVPTNTVLRNVAVTSTNSVYMNLSNIVFGGSVIIPNNFTLIRRGTVNYTAFIPSGTIITGATGWDNTITLPLVKSNSGYTAPSGEVDVVVDVGSGVELNFSQPVKIIIGDMEGKSAAWTRGAGTLTEIARECNDVDAPTNIDSVTNRECYVDSGDDLVIWTYHFTEFAAYTPEVITPRTPGGGGGGGGGGSTIEAINFTGNTGYVLDAGTGKKFSFFVGTSLKYIKIMIIQNPYVSFTVQDPVAVFTLSAGGITEVDFDGDGEVDIEVHLVSINENGKVNFKVVINDGSDELKPFTTSVLPPTTNAVKEQKVVNNTPPVQTINDDSENSKSLARVILKFLAISIAIAALVVMIIIVMITVYTKSKF